MPLTYSYVQEQVEVIKDWVSSAQGRNELKLRSDSDVAAYCHIYKDHFSLLSWTAANPFHTAQLENAKTKDPDYIGPTPEVKRALLRLRGLDLALDGKLNELLVAAINEPMNAYQVSEVKTIFKAQAGAIHALRWATVFRSTMMSPEAINQVKKFPDPEQPVNSGDSVTWLHQWVQQKTLLKQLSLPNASGELTPVIHFKNEAEKESWLKQVRNALYQPAHLRHMIFSETTMRGFRGVMTLDEDAQQQWFISWLVDLVAFGNTIGEYMTETMMGRALAVYEGITNSESAQGAFRSVEKQYIKDALSIIPVDAPYSAELINWDDAQKKLFVRLAGQIKAKLKHELAELADAMKTAGKEELAPWVRFYATLDEHPELPNPTFVPLLLEKMSKADDKAPLSKVITHSGVIMERLLSVYQTKLPSLEVQPGTPGRSTQIYMSEMNKLGPLNVHGIACNQSLLGTFLKHNNAAHLSHTFENHLALTWPSNGLAKPEGAVENPGAALKDKPGGRRTPSPTERSEIKCSHG